MRIVIDARMLYWTGVGRYTAALLDELQALDSKNEYLVLVRRADWDKWEPTAGNFRKIETNINPYTFGEQFKLTQLLMSLRPQLVHFTAPNAPLFYLGRRIMTVHDLTLLDFDTSHGTGIKRFLQHYKQAPFRLVLWWGVKVARTVITPTWYVRDEIVRRFGVKPQKIVAVNMAADRMEAKPEQLPAVLVENDFVLYAGNFY